MGGIDKLAWTVAGRPLLAWTLGGLRSPPGDRADRRRDARRAASTALAAEPWLPAKVRAVVAGGDRRQDSVAAGFAALESAVPDPDDRVVLVHDGARPVVSARSSSPPSPAASHRYGAAIPVVPVVETIKRLDGDRVAGTVDRADAWGPPRRPRGCAAACWRAAAADPTAGHRDLDR